MLALGIVIGLKLSLLTEEKMALLTIILLKVTVVLVLFLMCMPAHEARIISHGQNQNMMKNHKNKLIGAVSVNFLSLLFIFKKSLCK